ncbi:MAG: hypothetical protein ABIE47_02190 [Pseudomonadota bacterium]|nr:hypothetical protein [Pseudomonadota bacterium]
MRIKHLTGLFFLTLMPLFIAVNGCSTTESLTRKVLPRSWAEKVLPGQPYLKKRVMVFPLVDQAGLGPETTSELSHKFHDLLKKSPQLLFYEPPDGVFSSLAMSSPQFGVLTNSRLVDFAEGLGMNDLIIGVINPVEIIIRKTGIWPFDKWRRIYVVSVAVNVIDIASKTFLLTHLEQEDFSVDLDEEEERDEKAFIQQISTEALPEIIEEQASVVENKLNEEPWTGVISAVENNTIMINAGKEVGLKVGGRFEVFSPGRSISSGSGIPIHLFGESIGVIKVTSIMEKHSLAEPVSGGPFVAKQFVRFKR